MPEETNPKQENIQIQANDPGTKEEPLFTPGEFEHEEFGEKPNTTKEVKDKNN